MTTPVDYINRKFDVLALAGAQPLGEVPLAQSLFSAVAGGEVCTGVQKLSQRWAIEFLTIRGSMPFHLADRGTDFMRQAKRGLLRNETDIKAQFNFAAIEVRQNLLHEEPEDMHTEDRLLRATLLNIVLFANSLQLYVRIESQAGDSREVVLPIPITPINISM